MSAAFQLPEHPVPANTSEARCYPSITFALLKSDAFHNNVVERILEDIKHNGYHVILDKFNPTLALSTIRQFYQDHLAKPYFPQLMMSVSGPTRALVLESLELPNAISSFRQLIGATDARSADPGSIRGKYGAHHFDPNAPLAFNTIHASDSPAAMLRELPIMFPNVRHLDTIKCGRVPIVSSIFTYGTQTAATSPAPTPKTTLL